LVFVVGRGRFPMSRRVGLCESWERERKCVCETYARILLCRWVPGFVCLLLDVRNCTCWCATPTVLDQAWSQCWPSLRSLPSTAGCGSTTGRQLWRVYDIERMCLCVDGHDGCSALAPRYCTTCIQCLQPSLEGMITPTSANQNGPGTVPGRENAGHDGQVSNQWPVQRDVGGSGQG